MTEITYEFPGGLVWIVEGEVSDRSVSVTDIREYAGPADLCGFRVDERQINQAFISILEQRLVDAYEDEKTRLDLGRWS